LGTISVALAVGLAGSSKFCVGFVDTRMNSGDGWWSGRGSLADTSKFNYESLLHDDANLALNLRQYVMGFSPNVREIFAAFNFDDAIRDLERAGLLYLLMERFNEKSKVDLRPAAMSNHEMGYVFEHLLRKFNEALNQNPGEHFTPREVIRLMVDLVLMFDTDLASGEGVARTVNDCCCGTGGMLTLTKDRIQQINPQAKVFLYGQDSRSEAQTDEVKTARRQRRFGLAQRARRVRRRGKPPKQLNPQTWAIARSDMLILEPEGKDAENTMLPVCFWFAGRNNTLDPANVTRLLAGETEISLVA